eukprot:262271-Chlamydomonas_euryale.AAC.1
MVRSKGPEHTHFTVSKDGGLEKSECRDRSMLHFSMHGAPQTDGVRLHGTCVLGVSGVLYVRIRSMSRALRTVRAGEALRLPPVVLQVPHLPRTVWISRNGSGAPAT